MGGRAVVILQAILALVLVAPLGCNKKQPGGDANASAAAQTKNRKPVPPDRQWTSDEIAKDTEGYLKWADGRLEAQILDRQDRLEKCDAKLADIKARQQAMAEKVQDAENIAKRMESAYNRAEDEDRWPMMVGGRSFDKAKARAIIDQAKKYGEERRPLADAYTQAVERIESAQNAIRKDIEGLSRLREKLALDIERVKLNQGMEELTRLRNTEAEIRNYAKTLSKMTDETTLDSLAPPSDKEAGKVDIDSLLK